MRQRDNEKRRNFYERQTASCGASRLSLRARGFRLRGKIRFGGESDEGYEERANGIALRYIRCAGYSYGADRLWHKASAKRDGGSEPACLPTERGERAFHDGKRRVGGDKDADGASARRGYGQLKRVFFRAASVFKGQSADEACQFHLDEGHGHASYRRRILAAERKRLWRRDLFSTL